MNKFWKKSFYVVMLLTLCFVTALPLQADAAPAPSSTGQSIAKTALSYVGNVDYKYRGYSSPSQGLDNKGFVKYVLSKHGIDVNYSMTSLSSAGQKVTTLKAGDVLFFTNRSGSRLSAVGIYVGNGEFVGSSSYFDGVVKKKLSSYSSVYYGARRMTGDTGSDEDTDKPEPTEPTAPTSGSQYGNTIVDKAKKYLGVPYVFGSSASNTSSFDCSSYVQRVVYDAGLGKLPRTARSQAASLAKSSKAIKITKRSDLKPGDIIYFKNMGSHVPAGTVSHVAIYYGNNKIIQAMPNKGVIISKMTSYYTASNKFAGAYRIVKPVK